MEAVIVMNEQLDKLLVSVNWKEFEIGEIFEIKSGVRLTKNDMVSGDTPFIGATDSNNGITNFISNENASLDSNVLGVNYDGSVVENFYHPYEALFSDSVKRLSFKEIDGNKYHYLFLKTMILEQKEKYMYAYKFNAGRMIKQKILLPATPDGQPDWNFMQEYMMMVEQVVQPELDYTPYVVTDNRELDEVDWGTFTVGDVFSVNNSKAYHKSNLELHGDGAIPYITRTVMNNGLDSVICDDGELISNPKSIAFGAESVVFFYHDYNYVTGNKMYTVMLEGLNKYSSLFLVSVFNNNLRNGSFGYGRGLTGTRFKRQKVLLPIDSQGNPDWNFMEQYMKRIENDIMKDINIKHKQHVAVVN